MILYLKEFLLPHIVQFDCIVDLLFLLLTIFRLVFSVFFYMISNKFLFASFISVPDNTAEPSSLERSSLHVICFFIKINKILKIIKILNDFYNVVDFSSSFISLIFSFIFSYISFSVIILVNSL